MVSITSWFHTLKVGIKNINFGCYIVEKHSTFFFFEVLKYVNNSLYKYCFTNNLILSIIAMKKTVSDDILNFGVETNFQWGSLKKRLHVNCWLKLFLVTTVRLHLVLTKIGHNDVLNKCN